MEVEVRACRRSAAASAPPRRAPPIRGARRTSAGWPRACARADRTLTRGPGEISLARCSSPRPPSTTTASWAATSRARRRARRRGRGGGGDARARRRLRARRAHARARRAGRGGARRRGGSRRRSSPTPAARATRGPTCASPSPRRCRSTTTRSTSRSSSLVIAFMRDADAGAREMARVTRPGGVVAECMWDIPGGGMTMLSTFWKAVRTVDPRPRASRRGSACARARSPTCSRAPGSRTSRAARSTPARTTRTSTTSGSRSRSRSGPAGDLPEPAAGRQQDAIRRECFSLLGEPDGPFDLTARAWYARGTVPG